MSRVVLSGTICCLTTSVPSGSSTSLVLDASLRNATPCELRVCTLQLVVSASTCFSCARRSTAAGSGGFSPSTSVLSKRTEKSHQKIENDRSEERRVGKECVTTCRS